MSCNKCSPCQHPCNNNKGYTEGNDIKKLIIESRTHDRNKCTCEGCFHYNMGFTIMQNNRFYFVVDGWKDMPRNEYLRAFHRLIQYKLDKTTTVKKLRKFLKSNNAPPNMMPEIIEKMQSSIFIVMFKTSPMGMMREI